ncbi:MAG: hypothetical protein NT080_06610 [Spirochaetes bacterium]|nr:hypothetical protein [Spirochaetota bacterium]
MKRHAIAMFLLSCMAASAVAEEPRVLWRLDASMDGRKAEINLSWWYDDDEGREVAIVSFGVASPSPGIDELSLSFNAGRERGAGALEKGDLLITVSGRTWHYLEERIDLRLPSGTKRLGGYMDLDNFDGQLNSFLFADPLDPATAKELLSLADSHVVRVRVYLRDEAPLDLGVPAAFFREYLGLTGKGLDALIRGK